MDKKYHLVSLRKEFDYLSFLFGWKRLSCGAERNVLKLRFQTLNYCHCISSTKTNELKVASNSSAFVTRVKRSGPHLFR